MLVGGNRMANTEISQCIRDNLIAAGCNDEMIERFARGEDKEMQIKILTAYRRKLLETIHQEQNKLDCLDYLIFTLKKEESE